MAVSLSGLDMPWLSPKRSVKTGRFLYDEKKGKVVTAQQWAKANFSKLHRKRAENVPIPTFVSDIKPFVNVVTKDFHEISSRSQLRAFERSSGYRQVGNDFEPGQIAREKEQQKAEWEQLASTVDHGWTDFDG